MFAVLQPKSLAPPPRWGKRLGKLRIAPSRAAILLHRGNRLIQSLGDASLILMEKKKDGAP
jgi:hypothetical protein